ncbi:MAG: MATE family efflux transporter [Burkholderiales bacterium]|nr:MATE family efflux transporter [Burkholderiales bacterium]
MDAPAPPTLRFPLPALRLDARGRRRVDYRAIAALAAPLFANASLQAVLSLTDTWFIGRLSTDAVAAMGATYFLVFVAILLFGGVGMAVQTLAAQAYGGGRRVRGAQAVWSGLWASAATVPPFVALALGGGAILAPFALLPAIEALAVEYWFPRLLGGPASVAMWALSGFFNGIGRTRVTLLAMIVVALVNAAANEVLMFRLGLGMAGSAWATTLSLSVQHNLLQGFGRAVNARTITVSRINLRTSDEQFRNQVIATVDAVLNAYYSLLASGEEVKARRSALETAERFLKESRRRYELGALAGVDVLPAESQEAAARRARVAADVALAERFLTLLRA